MEEFITGAELMKRWKIQRHTLFLRITTETDFGKRFSTELAPYAPGYEKPYECWNHLLQDAHKRAGTTYEPPPWSVESPGDIYSKLDEVWFKVEDVSAWNEAHRRPRRLSNIHRERARQIAVELWEDNPGMTIVNVIYDNSLNAAFDGKVYAENTIRNWIKDLCPNRRPGRRPRR